MHSDVREALRECAAGVDAGRLNFTELVTTLAEVGVEGYYADFRRAEKTYYVGKGRCYVLQSASLAVRLAEDFSMEEVRSAGQAMGTREITYVRFCELLAAAGCVGYFVSLAARRVVYDGRRGESFVEPFEEASG
jgi:uncharacterized protein YbcV (DUF1398 family)